MQASEESIEEFKKIYREKEGKEISDQEAYDGAQNLTNFAELLYELAKKDIARKRRLDREPNGFPVDGIYSCLVCHNSINETTGWYDWYGQTCLLCRKAIKDGIIPVFVCKKSDSYFSMSALNYTFKIKTPTAKKYIRENILHPRIILDSTGKPYYYIFLRKENPGLIERYSPEYKSYTRHRNKVSDRQIWESKKKWRSEVEAEKKKPRKRIEDNRQ